MSLCRHIAVDGASARTVKTKSAAVARGSFVPCASLGHARIVARSVTFRCALTSILSFGTGPCSDNRLLICCRLKAHNVWLPSGSLWIQIHRVL
jgi:hypothetical protein